MIELNLLPDVKLQYIKAQRSRRLVIVVAALVTTAAVALLILLLAANGLQKKHLGDLDRDIKASSKKLQGQPQISRILTVQNQLQSLTGLHDDKPAASRLFDYLNQVTPAEVSISNLTVDLTAQTITATGNANALATVNKYVDTLKFTTYEADDSDAAKAFNNVVLSTFGLASDSNKGKPASYTITMAYDKNIFDITKKVKLTVPSQITTRSELQRPLDLFQAPNSSSSNPSSGGGQ